MTTPAQIRSIRQAYFLKEAPQSIIRRFNITLAQLREIVSTPPEV